MARLTKIVVPGRAHHVTVKPVLDRIPYFRKRLEASTDEDFTDLRRAEATGRPLGTEDFVAALEKLLGRPISRRAPAANRAAKSIKTNR